MVQGSTRTKMQPIRLERFLPRESRAFQTRAARALEYLKAILFEKHFAYAIKIRNMDWAQIVSETLTADLAGVKEGVREFSQIIDEVDAKPVGWILDRATTLMRELHSEIRRENLDPGYTVLDFLKEPPVDTNLKETVTNFDPTEMFVRTFGYVSNFIDMGKNGYLLPSRLAELEQRFENGYIFLRAAHILSQKV